jgi:hypothetical protein
MQSIHCKVSCNDQFRRFLFVGTEFSSLFSQVQQLLALDKEFVLKYKDNEGDLITLASNEELACALNYSEGNILRLVALPKDAPVTTESDVPVCSREFLCGRRGRGGRFHGRGYGHHGHGYGAYQGGPMHGGCGSDMFKAKWQSKIDYFKSQLNELEKVPEKTPEQQQEVLRLQKKLKKFESILEGGWEKKGKHGAKWEDKQGAKWEKKKHKIEKRMRKKEQKNKRPVHQLSEETRIQIATMKSQIDMLKPPMKEVKSQIKAKKDALKEAKETGRDPNQLLKEVLALKETRDAQKIQIKPLKQKIRELKYASC